MGQSGPVPVPISPTADLRAALDTLADAVAALRFELAGPAQAGDLELRDRLESTIREYLDPRLARPGGPLVVALVGSTGSGKSTILNSLAGAEISQAGVLRPTTGRPIVWRHEAVVDPIGFGDLEVDTRVDDHPLLRSLVLVDTPDIDSQVAGHRRVTEAVLAITDVAVFVTTPQRYADAVPWDILENLRRRDTPVVVVLNRTGRRSRAATIDLARLLDRAGITPEGGIHEISEQRLRGEERLLPRPALRSLQATLETIATAQESMAQRAVTGAIADVLDGARRLLSALERQAADAEELMSVVRKEHEAQLEHLRTQLQQGTLVRQEVLDRWRRLIGDDTMVGGLVQGVARVSRRLAGNRKAVGFRFEAREEIARLLLARLAAARRGVGVAWALHPSADELLPLPGDGIDVDDVTEAVDEWMATLVDLVRHQGRGRHRVAKAASWGINAAATGLLIATFAHSGGLTGAEVGIAAGAAAVQQAALDHALGAAATARIVTAARDGLIETVGTILDRQAETFTRRVRDLLDGPRRILDLIAAVDAVEEAR